MNKTLDWVVLGRFGRVHGIKGFIRVHSFTEPPEGILGYTVWHAFIANQWQLIKLVRTELTNKALLVQVEGYDEREQIAQLTNKEIAIERSQLPSLKPGEYYWHELIGMQVVNQENNILGNVGEILPTGANDVLVVSGDKRYLIPYLPQQTIVSINSNLRLITVDWGLDYY